MPKVRLDHNMISGLDNPEQPIEYYDKVERGLMLRHSKAGTKTFCYRYRFREKNKRYTIGEFPGIGLADARKKVQKLRVKVNDGIDPQAEKDKRKYKKEVIRFSELAKEYKEKEVPHKSENTRKEYIRIVDVELVPKLGEYPIDEIGKHLIIDILDDKAYGKGDSDPAPRMANSIRTRLSRIFNFGIERGLVKNNPVRQTSKYPEGEKKRDRYYSDEEIRELWNYFEDWEAPTPSVFKMLLITGQRKTETMHMKWNDIKGDIWTISPDMTKNKQVHQVVLSDFAQEIIQNQRSRSGDSDYVFESPVRDNEPLESIKRAKETIQKHSNIEDFRPHDLRRTFATNLAKLKVDRTVLGKILNHKGLSGDSQVTAIYDRHSYIEEKREAMNKWGRRLKEILQEYQGDQSEDKAEKTGAKITHISSARNLRTGNEG
ncbi:tyrosine-type recombinase/integrase [Fodinibius sp. SL11]|uniref:tyrosine-type recombinase/integrase n=1 Tax=Fodinibius sp. SL11 TaxID=3425690 RepID=UPI003F8805E7